MSTLTVTKTYGPQRTLKEEELDTAFNSIEAFINDSLIDGTNIQDAALDLALFSSDITDTTTLENNGADKVAVVAGGITDTQIADSGISSPSLNRLGSVSTMDWNAGSVTQATTGLSVTMGPYEIVEFDTAFVDPSALTYTITITTFGNPVLIECTSPRSQLTSAVAAESDLMQFNLSRDGTDLGDAYIGTLFSSSDVENTGCFISSTFFDQPAAGEHTYTITVAGVDPDFWNESTFIIREL